MALINLEDMKSLAIALMQSNVGPALIVGALFYVVITGMLSLYETNVTIVSQQLTDINKNLSTLVQIVREKRGSL